MTKIIQIKTVIAIKKIVRNIEMFLLIVALNLH